MEPRLTVDDVERVQRAVQRGRPVATFVEGLRSATLPALLEYGCLQYADETGLIPSLPPAVQGSDLGRTLAAVPSPLGLRSDGQTRTPPARIDTCPAEFVSLTREDELDEQPWNLFVIRFTRSAQETGFGKTLANGLGGALYEMARNALEHSETSVPVLVGYQVFDGMALFGVADVGRGVRASLRTNPEYEHLILDSEAITTALQDGASRHGYQKSGLGFREVFSALASNWGHLRFRSGEGCVTMTGTDCGPNIGDVTHPPALPGFQVTVCCRTHPPSSDEPSVV